MCKKMNNIKITKEKLKELRGELLSLQAVRELNVRKQQSDSFATESQGKDTPFNMNDTFEELISGMALTYKDNIAFSYYIENKIMDKSFDAFSHDVKMAVRIIHTYDVLGRNVAIVGENSYEWIVAFFAIIIGGGIAVPIDKDLGKNEIEKLMVQFNCKYVLISSDYSYLAKDIYFGNEKIIAVDMQKLLEKPFNTKKHGKERGIDDLENPEMKESRCAAIFLTSGTTGEKKGVMLSQRNILCNVESLYNRFKDNQGNPGNTVAILPFSHCYGLIVGIITLFRFGSHTHICKSKKRIFYEIAKMKPKLMIVVPQFVEYFYNQLREGGNIDRERSLGKKDDNRANTLNKVFGGNLKWLVCGGAHLDEKYISYFDALNIDVLCGYGITECSPVVAFNFQSPSIGKGLGSVLDCCMLRFGSDGEIMVKGDNVMLGYYGDPENTLNAMQDGWLKTGDLGGVDDAGNLFITGRKKNLIILSNGENVSPEYIERELLKHKEINEIKVFSDGEMIIAEIFPQESLYGNSDYFEDIVEKYNKGQPMYNHIGKVIMRNNPFPKTPLNKIIRN